MPRHKRMSVELEEEDECCRQGDKPGQRNAANARERARMRILSKAFSRLKTTLPWVPPDTKLSKLDTLRLATSYIAHLRTILTDDGNPPPIVYPLNLTWPFAIQQQTTDRSTRSPQPWSSEEHQTNGGGTTGNLNIVPGFVENIRDSGPPMDPDLNERQTHFYSMNNLTENKHRNSDSLLNIG